MDSLNTILNSGTYGENVSRHNDNNSKIKQAITTLENVAIANKGYFDTLASLQAAFPSPKAGNIAYVANVASSTGYYIYNVVSGVWTATTTEAPSVDVAISNYAQHGYSSSPKTLKQVDDSKAESGGSTKTLKQVDDEIVQLAGYYRTEYVEGDDFVPFSDVLGFQSNNKRGFRYPIGTLPHTFSKYRARIFFLSGKVNPPNMTLTIREDSYTGNVIATATTDTVLLGGVNWVEFQFTKINSSKRLFVEIVGEGEWGHYRRNSGVENVVMSSANGYPPYEDSTYGYTEWAARLNQDFYYTTNTLTEKVTLQGVTVEYPPIEFPHTKDIPIENLRIALCGSSVTWGDGYLQSNFVKRFIEKYQLGKADVVSSSDIPVGVETADRRAFLGKYKTLELDDEFSFSLEGNEVSIAHGFSRSNDSASEIDLYVDDMLYQTFNNFNPSEIGTETKNFTSNGTDIKYDLKRAHTYNHAVKVNNVNKVVDVNTKQGVGYSIPSDADCAIIRKIGVREDGSTNVTHWLWFKTAPAAGANIEVSFDYGEEIIYEKTTIGKTSSDVLESPYGDGDVSYDTTQPASLSTGLDFRETDARAIYTVRFKDTKKRTFKLKVKGLMAGATGTPYFRFNFATNRIFYFQNAGIGGWSVNKLNYDLTTEPTRNWQNILKFNPDKVIFEGTPNEDWGVKGHKIYTTETLTLEQLRTIRTFPLKSIVYNSVADNYTVSRYKGIITAITETSVTFSGTLESAIEVGDVIQIGQYWSNSRDSVERVVKYVDGATITFSRPIKQSDHIYSSLSDFVGKEINVRNLGVFKTAVKLFLDNIKSALPSTDFYLLENPMPNNLARELWGYWYIMDVLEAENRNVKSVDYGSLRTWQQSQPLTKLTVDIATFTSDSRLNKLVYEFGAAGDNMVFTDVHQNGKSIYGKVVIENGWAWVVDQSKTGESLNKPANYDTSYGQVYNGRMPRAIVLDDSISGSIDILYASEKWSDDSCHVKNSNGEELYSDFLIEAIK